MGWLMPGTLGGVMGGGLFVLPGILAIMALSYVYAAFGNVPLVAALFFGLKAAVLAIVLEAVLRIGKRALKNNVLVMLAVAAFIGIFFFDVPFPIIVFGAALIGYVGTASGAAWFQGDSGHGSVKSDGRTDSLLGEDLPEHARPAVASALPVPGFLLVVLLSPVVAIVSGVGPTDWFSGIAIFFRKMGRVAFGGAAPVTA